ncbi:MAG TPA: DUF559 domain-containing protein [Actinomycetota bacterium]|nr:DUF559 domain-containing protein [Actinomycetota bacterium]
MGSNQDAVRRCELHAAGNHGVISLRMARGFGLPKDAISRLIKGGRWRRAMSGVYLVNGVEPTWATKLAIAEGSLGGCIFSHRTAGALFELDSVPKGHVEAVTHRSVSRPGVTLHRLQPDDRPRTVTVQGFAVTRADRTVMDLFAVLPTAKAELALEDALRRRLTTLDRLWEEHAAAAGHGRKGCRAFRSALLRRDHRDGSLASRMEAKLLAIARRIEPPRATPQFEVHAGGARYFIDLAYPHVKLGVEAHSIKWHLGEAKTKYDLERDRRLKSVGWTMLYYPWDDLHLRSQAVVEEIRAVRESLELHLF